MKKQGTYELLIENSMIDSDIVNSYLKIGDPRKTDLKEYREETGYNVIQLADYIDWDINKIIKILQKDLDWYVPDGITRATHFDCDAAEVKEFLKYKKWGVTQQQITSAHLIRDGRLSTEEARKLLDCEKIEEPEYWNTFLDKLGLNKDILEE